MNPIETLLSVLFMLIYVFANFRLARLSFPQRTLKWKPELLAYTMSFLLCTALIAMPRNFHSSAYLIAPHLLFAVLQFGILYLYRRDLKQNLLGILKLFTADCLAAELYVLLSNRSIEHMDWQTFFWLLAPVKLIAVLMLESANRRREKDRIALQMQVYRHQMEIMEQSQAQIRFLKHDMKNHLLHMNQLLIEQDTEKLRQYMQETTQHLALSQEFVSSGNHDIDSLLNYKLMSAQQLGTEIVTDMRIPADTQIPAFDINVILGNLLDNALEALKECENRRMTVSMRYESGILYIVIQNTCKGEPPAFSAKGAGHGLGLHSVRRTLEAYHGELKTNYENQLFTGAVMMYLNR